MGILLSKLSEWCDYYCAEPPESKTDKIFVRAPVSPKSPRSLTNLDMLQYNGTIEEYINEIR